jgi:hypothetical protein
VGSAVEGLPVRLRGTGYRHRAAAPARSRLQLGRRRRILAGLAETFTTPEIDFGVFHQVVGDGGGDGGSDGGSDGGVVEDITPVGERSVGGDGGGTVVSLLGESVKLDTKHERHSTAPVPADGAGG